MFNDHVWNPTEDDVLAFVEVDDGDGTEFPTRAALDGNAALLEVNVRTGSHVSIGTVAGAIVGVVGGWNDYPVPSHLGEVDDERVATTASLLVSFDAILT